MAFHNPGAAFIDFEKTAVPLVATDEHGKEAYPLDFETIHSRGILHRAVHIEITKGADEYLILTRADDRYEILGGHVDWLTGANRSESYEEAAIREVTEELNLQENWGRPEAEIALRLLPRLTECDRINNQLPSSHGHNNESVAIFRLQWQQEWGNPCDFKLSSECRQAQWISVEKIQKVAETNPNGINSALHLFLQRREIVVPLPNYAYQ